MAREIYDGAGKLQQQLDDKEKQLQEQAAELELLKGCIMELAELFFGE